MGDQSVTTPSLKYVPGLDGVRGLAILLVLCFHLLWSNFVTGSRTLDIVVRLRSSAWVGVDLFFALSGFLITGILLDTRDGPNFFRNFYARRALRIFPLYYAVLVVLAIAFHPTDLTASRPLLILAAYLQNTPLWWSGHIPSHVADFTSHLWSLATEEQFYLVWPLIVVLIRSRRGLLWLAGSLIVLSPVLRYVLLLHGAPFQETYKLIFCRADGLLAGAWLATAQRTPYGPKVLRLAPVTLAMGVLSCALIVILSGSFDFEQSRAVNIFAYSALAVTGTSLVAVVQSPSAWIARCFRWRILRFFGRYSYGLYVFHQMVAVVVEEHFGGLLRNSIHVKTLLHLVFMAIVLAITIPLTMLSYQYFERPFLRLKRFFDAAPAPRRRDPFPQLNIPGIAAPSPPRP